MNAPAPSASAPPQRPGAPDPLGPVHPYHTGPEVRPIDPIDLGARPVVPDRTDAATRRAAARAQRLRDDPEPSLARRFGQIGIAGWIIVTPTLLGLFGGRWLDRLLGTGIMLAAAGLMLGAGFGLWGALRWMHDQ